MAKGLNLPLEKTTWNWWISLSTICSMIFKLGLKLKILEGMWTPTLKKVLLNLQSQLIEKEPILLSLQ
jgi:hypothetical protein